jgi:hypothetical protein
MSALIARTSVLAARLPPALTTHTRLLAAALAIVFIVFILELIRRHKLQERYTILWLGVSAIVILIAAFPDILALPNQLLGLRTPVLAFIFVVLVALLFIILHLTVALSRQGEQITRLAQEQALESARRQQPPSKD